MAPKLQIKIVTNQNKDIYYQTQEAFGYLWFETWITPITNNYYQVCKQKFGYRDFGIGNMYWITRATVQ